MDDDHSGEMDDDHSSIIRKFCQRYGLLLLSPDIYAAAFKSKPLCQILSSMRTGEIITVAKNDALILSFGALLAENMAPIKYAFVSQRMRQMARLLCRLRNSTSQSSAGLSSFFKPGCFDKVVEAVLLESKYMHSDRNALKMGYSVRKCGTLLINKALREKNTILEHEANSVIRLYDSEWKYRILTLALQTLFDD